MPKKSIFCNVLNHSISLAFVRPANGLLNYESSGQSRLRSSTGKLPRYHTAVVGLCLSWPAFYFCMPQESLMSTSKHRVKRIAWRGPQPSNIPIIPCYVTRYQMSTIPMLHRALIPAYFYSFKMEHILHSSSIVRQASVSQIRSLASCSAAATGIQTAA